MHRIFTFPTILISSILFIEIFSFIAIKTYLVKGNLKLFYWLWFSFIILHYLIPFLGNLSSNYFTKSVSINIFMFFLIAKLCVALFFVISSIILWIPLLFKNNIGDETFSFRRRKFATNTALIVSSLPLSSLIYGIFKTAYDFKIHKVNIKNSKIPKSFNRYKIVQISDIHTGSLQGDRQLQKAVDIINDLKPDLVVFTGDLVNNESPEALNYIPILKQIKAKDGIYSILGNHDYGDYKSWKTPKEKDKNMQEMYEIHQNLNWKLLLNEHVILHNGDEKINLIGVENWGANLNFKKYGDLNKAIENIAKENYSILLSHDPSHWSKQVLNKEEFIDLTLSGHTHGFQFGVEIPGFKWSPSQYIYPQWAGLYKKNKQYLYVNRGLGCIGYMGRIGIKPEITLIELSHTS